MQRVWVLNGNNITQDKDFGAMFLSIAQEGVFEWLAVESGVVRSWIAIIECTRSNGDKIAVVFESTVDETISTTGTKKVFIEITQANIDDWSTNQEDWTGIWSIKTATSYPSWNYIPLASISSSTITDARKFIDGEFITKTKEETTNHRLNVNGLTWGNSVSMDNWYDLNYLKNWWIYRLFVPSNAPVWWLVQVVVVSSEWWANVTQTLHPSWFLNTAWQTYTRSFRDTWTSWEKLITWGVPKLSETPDLRNIIKTPNSYLATKTVEYFTGADLWLPTNTPWYTVETTNAFASMSSRSNIVRQVAHSDTGSNKYERFSASTSTWLDWEKQNVKPKSQRFTTPSYQSWNQDITYNHSLWSIPKKIEFIAYAWGYKNHGVYTTNNNSQNSVNTSYNNLTTDVGDMMYASQDNWKFFRATIIAVTATTFTVRYVSTSSSWYPIYKVLANLS